MYINGGDNFWGNDGNTHTCGILPPILRYITCVKVTRVASATAGTCHPSLMYPDRGRLVFVLSVDVDSLKVGRPGQGVISTQYDSFAYIDQK